MRNADVISVIGWRERQLSVYLFNYIVVKCSRRPVALAADIVYCAHLCAIRSLSRPGTWHFAQIGLNVNKLALRY